MTKLILPLLIIFHTASGQQDWKNLQPDDLFKLARQTAFDGQRDQSREMLTTILSQNTRYDEVRVFLARTYAWDSRWEEATQELKAVLKNDATHQEAITLLAEISFWKTDYDEALVLSDQGLSDYPASEALLMLKANLLISLQRLPEAAVQLQRALEINPAQAKASELLASLKNQLLKNTVGFSAEVQMFSKVFDPAYQASLTAGRLSSWGNTILRLNYSNRFSQVGWQPEAEVYPKIAKGMYAYLNYGFSSSDLFPKQKIGGELFSKLPKGWEASAGARYLYFNAVNYTTIYTGSLSFYYKSYWFSWRPYLTTGGPENALSTTMSARKYFKDSEHYISLLGAFGFSPDDRRIQSSTGLGADEIFLLKAQRFQVLWQRPMPRNFLILINASITHQELAFDQGNYVWIWGSSFWLRKRF